MTANPGGRDTAKAAVVLPAPGVEAPPEREVRRQRPLFHLARALRADASAHRPLPLVRTAHGTVGVPAAHSVGARGPQAEVAVEDDEVVAALKTVYDPEIPADIYELGLVYRVDIDDDRNIDIDMTLTAPGCPVANEMPGWVEDAVSMVQGVKSVNVHMVFEPPWTPERMSDEARVALDWY